MNEKPTSTEKAITAVLSDESTKRNAIRQTIKAMNACGSHEFCGCKPTTGNRKTNEG